MDNQQGKPNLTKFFNDPEFHFVIEMLSRNTENMADIGTIDISQSAETVKAIVAGRQETLKLIDNFKQDIESYKSKINKEEHPPSFK